MKYILLFSLMSAQAIASDFPDNLLHSPDANKSDSGIRGPTYKEIVAELNSLELSYKNWAEVVVYGRSVQGRPLTLIKIAKKNASPTRAVYIGGSIHGNEYLNIEDRLPRWFLEQTSVKGPITSYLNQGGVIYIAPILNPDGYDARKRENSNGLDLNRDYTVVKAQVEGFTEPETKALFTYLEGELSNIKLEVALDYHCCIGALLYPWSFKGPTLTKQQNKRHLDIGAIMQESVGETIKVGTTPVILGYSAKGTSKDFYFEHFKALGFTYEGRKGQENRFFGQHAAMWKGIIKYLLSAN